MKKSKFQFKVGDKVRSTYPVVPFQGIVVARTRYTKGAEAYDYVKGEALYIVDGGGNNNQETFVECFLELAQ